MTPFEKLEEEVKEIGYLDAQKMNDDLDCIYSLDEKMNYLININEKYINRFYNLVYSTDEYRVAYFKNTDYLKSLVFSFRECETGFSIPKQVYKKHFEKEKNNPKFIYALLKHEAKEHLKNYLILYNIEEKINSPLAKDFIKEELKKIKNREKEAKKLLTNNKVNIYINKDFKEDAQNVEVLRILAEYYKKSEHMYLNITPWLYSELIYLKKYLKDELKKIKSKKKITNPPSTGETKNFIINSLENINNKGWEYAFKSKNDYIYFTDLLTSFFENDNYKLPKNTITLKTGSKTKVAKVLRDIHKDLANKKLTSDTNYFDIIRVLAPFTEKKQQDLYKALTR